MRQPSAAAGLHARELLGARRYTPQSRGIAPPPGKARLAASEPLLCCPPQSRPNIFDLEIRAPEVLYETVVEVEEEVVLPLGDTPGT